MIRHVIQANLILLVQYAVGSLIPLLLIPHIVRVIGLTEYGHLAVLMAWGGYGAVFVQYAFQMTGPKRVMDLVGNESPASVFVDITVAKLFLLLLVLALLTVLIVVSKPLASSSSFAWILLFALPFASCLNSAWFIQAQGRFFPVCVLAIVGALLTLCIGFGFIKRGDPQAIDVAVGVSVFGPIFMAIGTMSLAIISVKAAKITWDALRVLSTLKEGWHLFLSQFVSMFYSASGPIVINYLLDAREAGAYSVTERVISALMSAAMLTHTAAYPRLAAAYKNDRTGYWRMLRFILISYTGVTLTIATIAWSMRDHVVRFLYGEVGNGHDALLFFGLAWLILGISGTVLTGYLTVSDRSRMVWPITVKILALSVGLGVPGILFFGSVGWLAALVIAQVFVLHTGFQYWRKEYVW